jgi:hypothetical protein
MKPPSEKQTATIDLDPFHTNEVKTPFFAPMEKIPPISSSPAGGWEVPLVMSCINQAMPA